MALALDNARMPRLADKLREKAEAPQQVEGVVSKMKKIIKRKK